MKYPVFVALGFALVAAGCFNPTVKNGGFACSGSQEGQCPGGYFCVNGLCVDSPNAVGGVGGNGAHQDLAQPAGDLAGAASPDLARPPVDMAQLSSMVDLARVQPDMSTTTSCAHDYCTPGTALDKNCNACVNKVCAKYPNCCDPAKGWIALCVSDTKTLCTSAQACH